MSIAGSPFKRLATRANFPLLNQVTFALLESGRISLWEVYQVAPEAPQRTQRVGRWDAGPGDSPGVLDGPHEDVASRRTNLTGLHIRCLTLESPPSTFLEDQGNATVRITGHMADLWNEIQFRSNFTYTCRTPADGQWGAPKSEPGVWSGMVGELKRNEGDVVIGPLDHTKLRSTVVDFCMGIQTSGFKSGPGARNDYWFNMSSESRPPVVTPWVMPFMYEHAIMNAFHAGIIVARWHSKLSGIDLCVSSNEPTKFLLHGNIHRCCKRENKSEQLQRLNETPGSPLQLTSSSARIAFVTIYLNTMLLYAFYTCFIISHLAVTAYSQPFSTLQELYEKRDDYDFGFVKGISLEASFKVGLRALRFRGFGVSGLGVSGSGFSGFRGFEVSGFQSSGVRSLRFEVRRFRLAPDSLYRDVWRDMVQPKYDSLPLSEEEAIQRVREGRYVHLMYGNKFYYKYAHYPDIMALPTKYMTIASSFAVQKGSPLGRIFSYQSINKVYSTIHLMRLRDTGVLRRYWERWRPRPASGGGQTTLKAFTLSNLMTAFLGLLLMAFLAFLILALECLISRSRVSLDVFRHQVTYDREEESSQVEC
ncbi:glutamate receptor 2-like [Penaeus japonicus]|uniref:glutamate receptor 2-like n=1 Tax=Penaeus japonicus TaxID=27405 RepID=UPI001C70F626|nr:glutamate receptor 2-like [Penaeus japonicus]